MDFVMAYTALYRKFRPLSFEEMVGQDHITRTLRNQVINNRVGHAYLFNGGRGTGKTSAAKILARAVNCLNPVDGDPCNECEICKAALDGSLTDIVEMDAASNNGVEDIRQIRETVNFLPSLAKYRVYIIDEVHMLSTGAFNALLKTLEEPPAHVKFILATTEPQKLPATILSRCQRFDFKKISDEYIMKRLRIIAKESNINITEEALKLIAVLAEGGMRDAISILERCVQDGDVDITEDKIKELVGIPKLTQINRLVENIIKYNSVGSLEVAEEIIAEGKDITNILWEIVKYVKDMLIYKTSKKLEVYSAEEIEKIEELTKDVSSERLIKMITELSELENTLKWSAQKKLLFETGVIKLSSNFACSGYEEIEKRLSMVETQLKSGKVVQNVNNSYENEPRVENKTVGNANNTLNASENINSEMTTGVTSMSRGETEKASLDLSNSKSKKTVVSSNDGKNVNRANANLTGSATLNDWNKVIQDLKSNGKMMLYTNLINTTAKIINDMTVGIEFKNGITPFGKTVLEKPENMQYLVRLVSQICGKEMRVKLVDLKAGGSASNTNDNDLPFNIIE